MVLLKEWVPAKHCIFLHNSADNFFCAVLGGWAISRAMCVEFKCFNDKEITQKHIVLAFTWLLVSWCFCSWYFWFSDDFFFPMWVLCCWEGISLVVLWVQQFWLSPSAWQGWIRETVPTLLQLPFSLWMSLIGGFSHLLWIFQGFFYSVV